MNTNLKLDTNIKFRRKSGLGFIQPNNVKGIIINNNWKTSTISEYFSNVIPQYIVRLQLLESIAKQVNYNMQIKLVGSGINAQIKMAEGCIARALIVMLDNKDLDIKLKDILVEHFDLLKTYKRSDLRIVERKKSGHRKARALKPTNKR